MLRDQLAGACPEMTALADAVGDFAALLTPAPANTEALTGWITRVRAAGLTFLHAYATGIERDRAGVDAALIPPWHNGRTEGHQQLRKSCRSRSLDRPACRVTSPDDYPAPAVRARDPVTVW